MLDIVFQHLMSRNQEIPLGTWRRGRANSHGVAEAGDGTEGC